MQTKTTRRTNTSSKHKYSRIDDFEDDSDNDLSDDPNDTTFDGVTPNLSNINTGFSSGNSRTRQLSHKINTWIHSLFWIGLAIFIIQYCDIIRVLRIDERIIVPLLYIAGIAWFGVISLFIYLGLYLPIVKKKRIEDYNVTHGDYIKITLVLTGVSVLTFIMAIWPVWRWMSILITCSLLMGCMMIPNVLPNF